MLRFKRELFNYSVEDCVYSQEISTLINAPGGLGTTNMRQDVELVFPANEVWPDGRTLNFWYFDTDRSGGDIAGWVYYGHGGNKLLIIND